MEIKWSEQQKAVIYNRNKNMLVSAAAGSGKTAVLVQRIISLLTDPDHPTDLDRMLVVTFTRAAAGEMRERVRTALNDMIAKDSSNERLRSQAVLIHNARISTIHSFCSEIIKNYFYEVDVDPSFRVMEDGEQKLMMADCAREVLEAAYEADDRKALDFAASYSVGKSSKKIQELIISAYNKISAQAWVDDWKKEAMRWWSIDSEEKLSELPEIKAVFEEAKSLVSELKASAEHNLEAALVPGGPTGYIKALESDVELLSGLSEANDYADMNKRLCEIDFKRISPLKKDEDPVLAGRIKSRRDEIKSAVNELKDNMLSADMKEIAAENAACQGHVEAFLMLLDDFSKSYAEKKHAKNLMDYGDLEHFALKILLKRNEDGTIERTAAAKEIAAGLDHVMTDEYQDSNDIQELILSAVSGNDDGRDNRFMVGDIKQSIYGFRNASPEIFTDTYERYRSDAAHGEVIDLHDNYRSGSDVIETLNYVFERVMSKEVGGVDYDDSQALHRGKKDEDAQEERISSELLLLGAEKEEGQRGKTSDELVESEAVLIANELKMLKKTGLASPGDIGYGDCAVLVRTGTMAQEMSKILQREGVPAYTESRTGYFTTVEVSTILSYINIIDNPLQDIPFAAVLFSPIVGCTTDELARIRIGGGNGRFYRAALEYVKNGDDRVLVEKLKAFFETYHELREKSSYTPIHRLLNEIYEKTGYRSYAAAMPGGVQRAANLDMLMQRAYSYEKTSYSGLFNFVRYIEELKKDDEDIGEAGVFSGNGDAVCVMTIHKSKGLEFPVVFLSGCAKQFNKTGLNEKILIHEKLGIGIDVADINTGRKKSTFYKKRIADAMVKEDKSEELRVLYVALTRAKKKLYITAAAKDLDKRIQKALDKKEGGAKPSYRSLLSANSYLDIILMAFSDHKMFEPLAKYAGAYDEHFTDEGDYVVSRIVSEAGLERVKNAEAGKLSENLEMLPKTGSHKIYDERLHRLFDEVDAYKYPFEKGMEVPIKVSVSDIKRLKYVSDDEQTGERMEEEPVPVPYIPEFMQENEEKSGAFRGTAYHKFWRYIDYDRLNDCDEKKLYECFSTMLQELTDKKLISEAESKEIYIRDFVSFAQSPLGKRMTFASAQGRLYRERPFTALMSSASVNSDWSDMDDIVVQGVIDAYFEEDDGYVLVDYKTDYVGSGVGDELVKKYKTQLDVYADALGRDLPKPIKEKVIYSSHLKKCIYI